MRIRINDPEVQVDIDEQVATARDRFRRIAATDGISNRQRLEAQAGLANLDQFEFGENLPDISTRTNPLLGGLFSGLSFINQPLGAITSGLTEIVDIFSDRDNASFRDFLTGTTGVDQTDAGFFDLVLGTASIASPIYFDTNGVRNRDIALQGSFGDITGDWGGDSFWLNALETGVNFIGDVALDPTTYLFGAGLLTAIPEAGARGAARELSGRAIRSADIIAGPTLSREFLSTELLTRIARGELPQEHIRAVEQFATDAASIGAHRSRRNLEDWQREIVDNYVNFGVGLRTPWLARSLGRRVGRDFDYKFLLPGSDNALTGAARRAVESSGTRALRAIERANIGGEASIAFRQRARAGSEIISTARRNFRDLPEGASPAVVSAAREQFEEGIAEGAEVFRRHITQTDVINEVASVSRTFQRRLGTAIDGIIPNVTRDRNGRLTRRALQTYDELRAPEFGRALTMIYRGQGADVAPDLAERVAFFPEALDRVAEEARQFGINIGGNEAIEASFRQIDQIAELAPRLNLLSHEEKVNVLTQMGLELRAGQFIGFDDGVPIILIEGTREELAMGIARINMSTNATFGVGEDIVELLDNYITGVTDAVSRRTLATANHFAGLGVHNGAIRPRSIMEMLDATTLLADFSNPAFESIYAKFVPSVAARVRARRFNEGEAMQSVRRIEDQLAVFRHNSRLIEPIIDDLEVRIGQAAEGLSFGDRQAARQQIDSYFAAVDQEHGLLLRRNQATKELTEIQRVIEIVEDEGGPLAAGRLETLAARRRARVDEIANAEADLESIQMVLDVAEQGGVQPSFLDGTRDGTGFQFANPRNRPSRNAGRPSDTSSVDATQVDETRLNRRQGDAEFRRNRLADRRRMADAGGGTEALGPVQSPDGTAEFNNARAFNTSEGPLDLREYRRLQQQLAEARPNALNFARPEHRGFIREISDDILQSNTRYVSRRTGREFDLTDLGERAALIEGESLRADVVAAINSVDGHSLENLSEQLMREAAAVLSGAELEAIRPQLELVQDLVRLDNSNLQTLRHNPVRAGMYFLMESLAQGDNQIGQLFGTASSFMDTVNDLDQQINALYREVQDIGGRLTPEGQQRLSNLPQTPEGTARANELFSQAGTTPGVIDQQTQVRIAELQVERNLAMIHAQESAYLAELQRFGSDFGGERFLRFSESMTENQWQSVANNLAFDGEKLIPSRAVQNGRGTLGGSFQTEFDDVAEMLSVRPKLIRDPGAFHQAVRGVNRFFRQQATLQPSFSPRNMYSAMHMNWVVADVGFTDYRDAEPVLVAAREAVFNPDRREEILGGLSSTDRRIVEEIERVTDVIGSNNSRLGDALSEIGATDGFLQNAGQNIPFIGGTRGADVGRALERASRYLDQATSSVTSTLITRRNRFAPRGRDLPPQGLDYSTEELARFTLMHKLMKNGETSVEGAYRTMNKVHFDYTDLTLRDAQFRDWGFPFWTFMSRNLPLQVEMLAKRPGAFNNLVAWQEQLNRTTDSNLNPSYFDERLNFTVPEGVWLIGGDQIVPDLQFNDLIRRTRELGEVLTLPSFDDGFGFSNVGGLDFNAGLNLILSDASPVVRSVVENLTLRDSFTERRLDRWEEPVVNTLIEQTAFGSDFDGISRVLGPLLVPLGWAREAPTDPFNLEAGTQWEFLGIANQSINNFLPLLSRMSRLVPAEDARSRDRIVSSWINFIFGGVRIRQDSDYLVRAYELNDDSAALLDEVSAFAVPSATRSNRGRASGGRVRI